MTAAKLAFTVEEFSIAIGISSRQARRIIADGLIKVVRVGSRVIVPAAEAERFLLDAAETWTPAAVGRNVQGAR